MKTWLLFAITSAAVYAVVNFIDKYVLERKIKDYQGMPIFAAIAGFFFGSIFWISTSFPILNFTDTVYIFLSGILTIWATYFYFKALSSESVSKIIILFQMTPVFVLLLSFIFLGEHITFYQLIGFFLILVASIAIGEPQFSELFKFSSTFFLIMIVNILWASAAVLFKFVVDTSSFAKVVSYESWGIGIGGLLLYSSIASIRKSFLKSIRSLQKNALIVVFTNEGFFVGAKLLQFFAYSLGPVSLVNVVGSTQVFFGVFYGYILTILWPRIFKEDISKKGMVKKVVFAVITFIGIYLVY